MTEIKIFSNKLGKSKSIHLTGSKSESNRALIINALCDNPGVIDNLADARDTRIMQELLSNTGNTYNAHDAGTVMRFMTAFLAIRKQNSILTGTPRMQKRPIGILVDALMEIGVAIDYLDSTGYPPLAIKGLNKQIGNTLKINSGVSSQYISALLMIAPVLPLGLKIKLMGTPVSTPYIHMTISIMNHFGASVENLRHGYFIMPQSYVFKPFTVEADWSAASYWYSIFALSNLDQLELIGLKEKSQQGDSQLSTLMKKFGIATRFAGHKAVLTRREPNYPESIDFITCPDLAQTFAVLCALIGHQCTFTGLQTLKIKETDRVQALKNELKKIGSDFIDYGDYWRVTPANLGEFSHTDELFINTYDDHRMAMAFAALATRVDLRFNDRNVVNKSYPGFWNDMETVGFKLT